MFSGDVSWKTTFPFPAQLYQRLYGYKQGKSDDTGASPLFSSSILSMFRPSSLTRLEFGFELAALHSSHQLQPFCPKGQSAELDTCLWLDFLGWQVPWLLADTSQFGSQEVVKFMVLRRAEPTWA